MKLKTKTDKFGVTTITCKAKARESFDSFAASSYSLGKKWFLPFKYEVKKKKTTLQFSVNNMMSLDEFLNFALLRGQFAALLRSISDFLTYSREHSVQSDYVLFDTKFVLINKDDVQLKFVYLPFKTPDDLPKSLYDFLVEVGKSLRLANESQDIHLLERYRNFFVLRELFSVTKFKDMVDSICDDVPNYCQDQKPELITKDELNFDCYEVLEAKKDVFVRSAVEIEEDSMERFEGLGALVRESTGERFVCKKSPCTFGSGEKADITIKGERAISRIHAQIEKAPAGFTIEDLGSTNGTRINGEKLKPHQLSRLKIGDTVKFANEDFSFEVCV